jgi:transcriptional regulator of acetoin/glycerol metabolism
MADYGVTDSTLPAELGKADVEPAVITWCIQWVFPLRASAVSLLSNGDVLRIGRDPSCHVAIDDQQASRSHAKVTCSVDTLALVDLESRNGTFVNGQKITRANLRRGDVIRIGSRIGVVGHGPSRHFRQPTVSRVAAGFWAGPTLLRALEGLQRLASTNLPIVIEGETGTGKERVARAIHEFSGRKGAFIGINCAAIPENLAEAELFGYRKGAFTGAEQAASGHLHAATGGTLLLDEVCDLPLALQAKLLRALEQNEIQRLGETRTTAIDVRIVTAARFPLADLVSEGRCRPDFAARLSGATIKLPGLRDRKEELPSLFAQLLTARLGSEPPELDAELIELLLLYRWPGNVRELDLQVRRLLGLHGHEGRLRAIHLAATGLDQAVAGPEDGDDGLPADERDVKRLMVALREHKGNLARAATATKMSRQRAYRLLQTADVSLEALRQGR